MADATGPVLIFGLVAIIPILGLALAFHVSYGQVLLNYSTIGKSLTTLLVNGRFPLIHTPSIPATYP